MQTKPRAPSHHIEPDLIGTTIRTLNGQTGEIVGCTIQDYGTSELRGDWFEVVYDDERELRISRGEMDEMLALRVLNHL